MIIVKLCLLFLLLAWDYVFCDRPASSGPLWNPSRDACAVGFPDKTGSVGFSVVSAKGDVLLKVKTVASQVQRWNLTWLDDNHLLFRSSDIGECLWSRDGKGHWFNSRCDVFVSRDGRSALSIYLEPEHIPNVAALKVERNSAWAMMECDMVTTRKRPWDVEWLSPDLFSIRDEQGKRRFFEISESSVGIGLKERTQ